MIDAEVWRTMSPPNADVISPSGVGALRLSEFLGEAGEPVGALGAEFEADCGRLAGLRRRLREERCHLAVLGQFKRGKSTLVNALLGAPVLPAAVVPLTSIPTFLHGGGAGCGTGGVRKRDAGGAAFVAGCRRVGRVPRAFCDRERQPAEPSGRPHRGTGRIAGVPDGPIRAGKHTRDQVRRTRLRKRCG